ncbi:hypothetical protein HMPREF0673_00123 [Leyella stercorea DSM 18206]|uniref:Uncharacterized protein n=1 Tax=Leyella stercorea DSM 18206 TaxID=1002367 RepID=G6AU39_9BACT|nr:hypothetical protein HMPREF0673_00123 [Leyella stercorea DSM 18206]
MDILCKDKGFIRYWNMFQQKKFLFRKSNWKMTGRFALAERYLPAIMLLIV